MKKKFVFKIYIAFFVVVFACTESLQSAEENYPFIPGEKLTFQLKWGLIPVGTATLEVLPIETINGIKSYHFVMTAKSYSFIDNFYKIRDRIDAYTDLNMTHSILYKKQQHEGKTKKNIIVNFDWKTKKAQYSNFGNKKPPISILTGSFDPLSVLYYARFLEISEDKEIICPVTDGKKSISGKAKIIQRSTINVLNGKYDTYLLEPELKDIGGVFEKSENAKIKLWITTDKRRIPVKIKSKVVVGSFVGELIAAEKIM